MKGACQAVELLEFAVFYGGATRVVQAVVVVKVAELTAECLSGGGLIYTPYVPTHRFGIENSFQFCIVVKRHML